MPALYMVELVVSDWQASASWYADVFGLRAVVTDAARGFVLMDAVGGRLALKQGNPRPGTANLVFSVADLAAELARLAALGVMPESPVKTSDEGYRRAFVRDPDGYRVGLFEWVRRESLA
ncbi:MAG: VOC family protein [Gemmataceae bacterium]